MLKCDGSNID